MRGLSTLAILVLFVAFAAAAGLAKPESYAIVQTVTEVAPLAVKPHAFRQAEVDSSVFASYSISSDSSTTPSSDSPSPDSPSPDSPSPDSPSSSDSDSSSDSSSSTTSTSSSSSSSYSSSDWSQFLTIGVAIFVVAIIFFLAVAIAIIYVIIKRGWELDPLNTSYSSV